MVDAWKKLDDAGVNQALKRDVDFLEVVEEYTSGKFTRKFSDKLKLEEEAILRHYTTNRGYKDFNRALRGEIPMNDKFLAQEKMMNEALDKLPNYNNQSTLWRGLKNLSLDDVKAKYVQGEKITEPHFVSSAYNVDDFVKSSRARGFDYIIKIEGRNGKLIEGISTLPEEAEVLFKSGTQFKVEKASYALHPDETFLNSNGIPTIWTIVLKEL